MAWTFVRPTDPSVLVERPLLDLGTGDGQTVRAVTDGGVRVGVDRSLDALRAARGRDLALAAADVRALPFADAAFATVLAADLFHHLDNDALGAVLGEIVRVLRPGGRLIAWWYERPGRGGPGDPRFSRPYTDVARAATAFGLRPAPLELVVDEGTPPTAGLIASC